MLSHWALIGISLWILFGCSHKITRAIQINYPKSVYMCGFVVSSHWGFYCWSEKPTFQKWHWCFSHDRSSTCLNLPASGILKASFNGLKQKENDIYDEHTIRFLFGRLRLNIWKSCVVFNFLNWNQTGKTHNFSLPSLICVSSTSLWYMTWRNICTG